MIVLNTSINAESIANHYNVIGLGTARRAKGALFRGAWLRQNLKTLQRDTDESSRFDSCVKFYHCTR